MGAQLPWPADFSELKKLGDILQCSICYEYINTCMVTPCSHNFCSLCIRKYLQYKMQCPTCFQETYGGDLRKNRLVDDVISIWVKLKDRLLFNLRLMTMTQSIKDESKVKSECNGLDSPIADVKTQSKSIKKEIQTPKQDKNKKVAQKLFSEKKSSPEKYEAKSIVLDGVVIPSMFQPQKSPKKAVTKRPEDMSSCPVCSVDVPLRNLNMHLDSCLAASDPDSRRQKPKPEKREPIPKRVYTLLKEKDLKKYLKDYGLNTNGDRKAMENRLTRYIVLYNAECDKEYPRAVVDLVKQVEREEKDEKTTASNPLFQGSRPPVVPLEKKKDPEAIEKANKDYLEQNRDSFKKLIENMKARNGTNIKPLKPLNRIESDDEDDAKPSTSKEGSSTPPNEKLDKISSTIYSQITICGSDSEEEDMFDKSPVRTIADVHRIDWDKTELSESTQCDAPKEPNENNVSAYDPEETIIPIQVDSDSYDSVFDTSLRSEPGKTPKSNKKLSAKKKSEMMASAADSPSSSKLKEKFNEIFEEEKSSEETQSNSMEEGEEEEKDNEDSNKETTDDTINKVDEKEQEDPNNTDKETSSDESSDDDSDASVMKTPTKYDVSPEISPAKLKRVTRSSVKRKSDSLVERTPPASEPRVTRRKKMKHSASPEF